jgi:nitrite reductase (cytochrome c-552)
MTNTAQPVRRPLAGIIALIIVTGVLTFIVLALLINIMTRRQEAMVPFQRVVHVDETIADPAIWGQNWPRQYDGYKRTVDYERTRYGGSDAVPIQKLDAYPWLRTMWSGHAFSLDYRESRGHAFTLADQDHTERVAQRPQPGACLHCHASIMPAYRHVGNGDVMEGFRLVNSMKWNEARQLTDAHGGALVAHPVACIDCHDPQTMDLRITRPGFINGIRVFKESPAGGGIRNYDPNRDATRQEMRSYVCAQCHVEYYFTKGDTQLVFPWHKGLRVEQAEAYYDEIGFHDWIHGITGAPMLKAQHPEFELWSQGIHAQAGVSCADCHMPYRREGAMKVSDHHVRSPLLDVAASCQTCHRVPEQELLRRAHTIQDRTHAMINRTADALMDLINAIAEAKAMGANDEQLTLPRDFHRKAQWRLDYIFSEGSHGFHADQEAARILAESIDYSRQGIMAARNIRIQPLPPDAQMPEAQPVEGVTPKEKPRPGPRNPPQ